MKTARLCALIGAAMLLACGSEPPSPQATPQSSSPTEATSALQSSADTTQSANAVPEGAEILGTITFRGADPDVEIPLSADPHCRELNGGAINSGTVEVDAQGRLANVFLYISKGLTAPPPPAPASAVELDQNGCRYRPRVLGLRVGQPLVIKNSDSTIHNVHGIPTANPEFNQGTPARGMQIEKRFEKPDVMVRMKCDVHPWMSAWIGVLDHPYFAVSDALGKFRIAGLPAGTYTLTLWHESLGRREQSVTVEALGKAQIDFDLTTNTAGKTTTQ